MPGLMSALKNGGAARPQMQGAQQPPARSPMPPQPQQDQQGGGANNETAKKFLANVLNAIYAKETLPTIIKSLKSGKDPINALANTAVQVIMRVQSSAQQNGVQPSLDDVLRSGAEAVTDLANLSAETGGRRFSDKEIQAAFLQGVDLYRTMLMRQGKLDPNEYKQKWAEMQAADKSGELEKLYPGMRQATQELNSGKGGGVPKSAQNMRAPMPQESDDTEDQAETESPAEAPEAEPRQRQNPSKFDEKPREAAPKEQFKRKGQRLKDKRRR